MAVVRLEVADGVGTIRLDRPKVNAFNAELTAQLREVALEASRRADIRAVVIYGGERAFAAGADIKEMAAKDYAGISVWVSELSTTFETVARLPMPVFAAVTGYALGGGLELALCADFRILADNAKLGVPEILLGVIPGAGGTQRLPRLVGPARAKELVFSGRQVGAEEALAIGLADAVVPAAEVYAEALRRARQYVDGPALALAAAKRAIDDGLETGLSEALRLETGLFVGLFGTEDQKNGMESFQQNGPGKATFTGH
ncbi:putative enoyl-CoA hydratase echA8 [Frankia canadensis]|uniref:enoyl-CoA hydratase n=1 Tax=Frankia canadensis TaxID=1836972 RepID=A0A2I2KI25_9ACTN|nr:enoyl-CoA hydratase-related protein [Frankia canadensis]SNQ45316.1 putative enoyl-CoA hydratase echA8 [Frankia canadensis]SOU52606.1 putative enoyl-CoA hydratase echA8 [Frankia canadensis]